MCADVGLETTRFGHSAHLNKEQHRATNGHCAPSRDTARPDVSLPVLAQDRLRTAKALADKAVKMHKIFSIQGPYPVIRAALRARGWVEQRMYTSKQEGQLHQSSESSSNGAGHSDDENSNSTGKDQNPNRLHSRMSHLVQNKMVYFYWTNRRNAINLQKEQIINHFAKAGNFTTKAGLCVNMRNLHWFDSTDPDTFFPRCYRLAAQDDRHAFIEDYRRTACTSLLKYIVKREQVGKTVCNTQNVQGQSKWKKQGLKPLAPSQLINIALKICQEYQESLEHRDIDKSQEASQTLTQEEWEEFINSYYLVVHGGEEIEISDNMVSCCKAMLQRMEKVSPQLGIDGTQNIWIIKPGAKSRGKGIKCFKRLDQILQLVDVSPTLVSDSKWVVQKYIEQPLLIHDTKFDVRQWFLVTDWNPLTVWFYKKCYLRFSTQPYSLDTLDRSVHLCNNSIQKHLRPSPLRHRGIPAENMWLDEQFRAFLAGQGREALWETVVVPGMKKALIHALQTAQDLIESRKNTFELYGADFVLGQDLHPWLIEINASPTMAPSTSVTARLCASVQEDTLRVVLDRRVDRAANTGDFQLIYKQAAIEVPQYIGIDLLVEGSAIKRPCHLPPLRSCHHFAAKHKGHNNKKNPAGTKVSPLPKVFLKGAELKNNDTEALTSPPPLQLFLPKPAEITFHLPTPENKSVSLSGRSHSELLWKRRTEVSNVYFDNIQPFITVRHISSLLPHSTHSQQLHECLK